MAVGYLGALVRVGHEAAGIGVGILQRALAESAWSAPRYASPRIGRSRGAAAGRHFSALQPQRAAPCGRSGLGCSPRTTTARCRTSAAHCRARWRCRRGRPCSGCGRRSARAQSASCRRHRPARNPKAWAISTSMAASSGSAQMTFRPAGWPCCNRRMAQLSPPATIAARSNRTAGKQRSEADRALQKKRMAIVSDGWCFDR